MIHAHDGSDASQSTPRTVARALDGTVVLVDETAEDPAGELRPVVLAIPHTIVMPGRLTDYDGDDNDSTDVPDNAVTAARQRLAGEARKVARRAARGQRQMREDQS